MIDSLSACEYVWNHDRHCGVTVSTTARQAGDAGSIPVGGQVVFSHLFAAITLSINKVYHLDVILIKCP